MFQFENFRVRKLCAIIKTANPVKKKVFFCYYRLAKGISGILSYAKEGVRLWFRTKRLLKSGSGGAYLSASNQQTVFLFLSKKRQIGTLVRLTILKLHFAETQDNHLKVL